MPKEKTKAIVSPAVAEAKIALANMPPALRTIYDRVAKKIGDLSKTDILTRFDLGKEIDTAMTDKRKYGEEAVKQLAAALNLATTHIYDLARLYTAFKGERDALKALIEKPNANGGHITYSHMVALLSVPESKRNKFMNMFFDECLNVRDLQARIAEELGVRSGQAKGKMSRSRSPVGAVASMSKVLSNFAKVHEDVQSAVFEKIEEDATSHADDTTVAKLEELSNELTETARLIEEDQRKLAMALENLFRIQRYQESMADEEEDDGGDEPPKVRKAKVKTTPVTKTTKKVTSTPAGKTVTIIEENADGKVLSKITKPASSAATSVADRIAAAKAKAFGGKRLSVARA